MAVEALREAQAAPEDLRLNLIVIAQQSLELADKLTQLRRQHDTKEPSE
jgi:hypothetical protein